MEMMHQVWAAGLHDAANCFQDALEAKWKLEAQGKAKPKTNSDRIRAMTDEELAKILNGGCPPGGAKCNGRCGTCWLEWLRSPVEEVRNESPDSLRGIANHMQGVPGAGA